MNLISFLKKNSTVSTLLFIIEWLEWLESYIRYLIWIINSYIYLVFFIFVFLDILSYSITSTYQKKKLNLIRLLEFMETLSSTIIILMFLLLIILSIVGLMHETLTFLLSAEYLWLVILNLEVIFLKFFVKTSIWVFMYTNTYKFYMKVFFQFRIPLEKCGNFLLKIFPIITTFIVFITLSLLWFLITHPNCIIYL
jgi:hypothetical protein